MIFLGGIALGMLVGAVATFAGIWRAEYEKKDNRKTRMERIPIFRNGISEDCFDGTDESIPMDELLNIEDMQATEKEIQMVIETMCEAGISEDEISDWLSDYMIENDLRPEYTGEGSICDELS